MQNNTLHFDDNDLSLLPGVRVEWYFFNNLPARESKINKLARQDRSILTSAEYSVKEVVVRGSVSGCDRAEVESRLILLKSFLQLPNRLLVVSQGGLEVGYLATMTEMDTSWTGYVMEFTIIFTCADPVGEVTTSNTALNASITDRTATFPLSITGSFKAEPIITLTINSVSDATDEQLTVGNGITGQGITIARTFEAGDIISINSKERLLVVNGQSSDYSGTFPLYFPGNQVLSYVDTFSDRDVSIVLEYKQKIV